MRPSNKKWNEYMDAEHPDEISEDIKKLEERSEHLENWLESLRKNQEVVPFVQEIKEQTEWQIRVLQNRPSEASEIPYKGRHDELERENNFFYEVFPVLKTSEYISASSATAITSSGTIDVYDYANRIRDLGTQDAIDYGDTIIGEYHKIQESQGRLIEVRSLLDKFGSPNLLERYDRAYNAYMAYESNTGEKTAAANDMRNLLYGLRGELMERARNKPRENMTWEIMSQRLAIGGDGSQQCINLINQKETISSLNQRLSDVLKDRERGSITDLNTIWTELLDHIYTVLRLINL